MNDDLISRQTAINHLCDALYDLEEPNCIDLGWIEQLINELPCIRSIENPMLKEEGYKRSEAEPNFFWIYTLNTFNDIKPSSIVRLILLASMMNYSGQIMRNRKEPMTVSDLQSKLKLGRAAVYQFLTECNDYIYTKDKFIFFYDNCKIFKGRLPSCEEVEHYQKVFCEPVQKLFEETDKSQLKPLGYVFQVLPYINLEYNVLAISDPYENDFDRVQQLSTKQFCQLIGYNPNQSSRLKKELKALQFEHKDKKEYLLRYINTPNDTNDEKIVINPHILYNGQQYENVKIGNFCKEEVEQTEQSEKACWYDIGSLSCRCSKCGCKNNRESRFCPNCGTKMKNPQKA